jgi:hypothetical protein
VYSGRLRVTYDSKATNRSAVGGGGGSHRVSSLLPIGHLGVIQDSKPHGYALFIAVWIRSNYTINGQIQCGGMVSLTTTVFNLLPLKGSVSRDFSGPL